MLAVDDHIYRDGSDAAVEYFVGLAPYSNNPVWVEAWCVEGPSQEVNRIVEAELSIGILNIVFREQVVDIKSTGIVRKIKMAPRIAFGQGIALGANL
jgi:hypothetical protein